MLSSNRLPWSCPGDPKLQEIVFRILLTIAQTMDFSKRLLCNSVYELDYSVCQLIPNMLPIGPLLASNRLGHYSGNFWPDDLTCISWLNEQPAGSVIYAAFGSIAILSQHQFNELALGLELAGRPFLCGFCQRWWLQLSKMEAPIIKDGGFKLSIIWPPTLHFFFLVR